MKAALKNVTTSVIFLAVLAILFGAVMIVYPGATLATFGWVFAVYLIAHGLILIIVDIKAWRLHIPFAGFLSGLLYLILGVLLAAHPETFQPYIGLYASIWLIVSAINGIKLACALRGISSNWWVLLIINILNVAFGVLYLLVPELLANALTVVIGVMLIVYAITAIATMVTVKKEAQSIEKKITDQLNAITAEPEAPEA